MGLRSDLIQRSHWGARAGRDPNASVADHKQIRANARRYRHLAKSYERRHGEIFNPIEQTRLRSALRVALAQVNTPRDPVCALDFGCGTGNLTTHLLALGAKVTAADLSPQFLRMAANRNMGAELTTLRLNGRDLSEVSDRTFDFVATYSVLHHVPDYALAVSEMCRVLTPGGVLYIDHEASPSVWRADPELVAYRVAQRAAFTPSTCWRFVDLRYLETQLDWLYTHIRRRLGDPRFFPEGDIHIWPDDHIEWERLDAVLEAADMELLTCSDYLVYDSRTPHELYNEYVGMASDTRMYVARRRGH